MTDNQMQEELEIRIYPIKEEDQEWAMGVFQKNQPRLCIKPEVYRDRFIAAQAAQALQRMSGMQVRECRECQDLSYDYESVIARRLLAKAFIYGGLLFLAYFLSVKFL